MNTDCQRGSRFAIQLAHVANRYAIIYKELRKVWSRMPEQSTSKIDKCNMHGLCLNRIVCNLNIIPVSRDMG
jgi:hypothetical protein